MEEIKVYNTLTKEKEVFKPITPGEAKIYVCGVTPYNHPHIGNARPAVTWDVIRRYLEYVGYKVTFVQNFTDVDDKIINKANAEGTDWKTISDRYIDAYFQVMDALHVRRADVYPRVSEHMDDIIHMVETLIEKGHAYVLGGDVYYDISTFKDYGRLSGRKIEDMLAGARIEVNDEKKNPGDFALWKAAKPGEPFWESPWGKGRPGWHIECSAMSIHYLGKTFDFHGGGSDLIFPHHENEIAQSEGCTDCHFVDYWLHNGFITINSEKMSKSLNNFFLVKDVLEKYSGDALRYFLLSTHYRSPLDFSDDRLEEAEKNMDKLKDVIARVKELSGREGNEETEASKALEQAAEADMKVFHEAMDDDFNTYNINADDAACAIAEALNAEKLAFLTDIEGVYKDPKDPESLISELHVQEARDLITNGNVGGGMIPKLQGCIDAIENGVSRVHIMDGRIQHCLLLEIFTNKGIGTAILGENKEKFNHEDK